MGEEEVRNCTVWLLGQEYSQNCKIVVFGGRGDVCLHLKNNSPSYPTNGL